MQSAVVRPAGAFAPKPAAAPSPAPALVQSHAGKKKHKGRKEEWDCVGSDESGGAKKRVFFWEASGSLAGLAGREYFESPLTTEEAVMYKRSVENPEARRVGDAKRAILLDGVIRSVTNRFPVTMVLSSNYLRGRAYGKGSGDSYERGLLIVPGNREVDYVGADGRFLLPHPSLTSEVVQRFAKDAHRNLRDECTFLTTGNVLVPLDSPIIMIVGRNEKLIQQSWPDFSMRRLEQADGKLVVPAVFVEEAVSVFERMIRPRMPHVDMTQLSLRLKRYGADWTDPVIPGADQTVNSRLASAYYTFSIEVELTYRLSVHAA